MPEVGVTTYIVRVAIAWNRLDIIGDIIQLSLKRFA